MFGQNRTFDQNRFLVKYRNFGKHQIFGHISENWAKIEILVNF